MKSVMAIIRILGRRLLYRHFSQSEWLELGYRSGAVKKPFQDVHK